MSRQQSRAALLIILFGAVLLACLKAPRAPSWDTTVTLPLFDRTVRLMDILPKNYFSVGADSVIQFHAEARIDTLRPGEAITFASEPATATFQLRDLTITGDFVSRLSISLEELLGIALPEEPVRLPVAPFSFVLDRQFTVSRIREAELLSGRIQIQLENHSQVPLDSLRLTSELVGNQRVTGILPNRTRTLCRQLGASRITTENRFRLIGGGTGTGQESVLVSRADSLVISFAFDSLRLISAELQPQLAEAGRRLMLGVAASKPFRLDSVVFAHGYAELNLANNLPLPLNLILDIPRLACTRTLQIPALSNQPVIIDLAGKSLASTGLNNSLLAVNVRLAVTPDNNFVRITKDQTFTLVTRLSNLQPAYLRGELREPLYVTPEPETLPRLLPSGLPGMRLPRCRLELRLTSAIGYAGRLNLRIRGQNKAGDTALLERTIYLAPGSPEFPRTTEYVLPLHHVLSIGPEQLQFAYSFAVSGYGTLQQNSFISGSAVIATPLRLALCADTVDLGEKMIPIDQGIRTKLERYLVAGELQADVRNHFPLGMQACVFLRPDTATGPAESHPLVLPLGIPTGTVDAAQCCQQAADTTLTGTIDEPALGIFHSPRLKCRILLYVPSTDTVQIREQDYLRVIARAALRLRVGGKND